MKKFFVAIACAALTAVCALSFTACGKDPDTIYVDTNAFFAPFEYYQGTEIVGVDVDIMNKVGEKLNKKVKFKNTDFGVIIDNVASGKRYDCGAAGITVTAERQAKVDFSDTYFTSVQYVICNEDTFTADEIKTADDGTACVFWESLAGKKIGVQTDTTGDLFVNDEINAKDGENGYDFDGAIYGTGAEEVRYDDVTVAVTAMQSNKVNVVVVDKLPAEYIVQKYTSLKCYALYYDAETATEEEYAICVTKGNNELLEAINAVLKELGPDGINELVAKHLGLD